MLIGKYNALFNVIKLEEICHKNYVHISQMEYSTYHCNT